MSLFYYERGELTLSRTDFWTGIGFMCLAVLVFILTIGMIEVPRGISPADYPRVIAVGLFILGAIQAVQGWKKGSPALKDLYPPGAFMRVLGLVLITFVYVKLMGYLGFLYLTPFFLYAAMYYFGVRKPVSMVIISIAVTVCIYVVFKVAFHVPLPRFTLF